MTKTIVLPKAMREVRVNRTAMDKNRPRLPVPFIAGCDCLGCKQAQSLNKMDGDGVALPVFTITEPDGTLVEAHSVRILGECQLVYERGSAQGCTATPGKAFIRTESEMEIVL